MELSLCLHKPSQDMVETCVSHIPRVRNLRLSKLPNCTEVEKLLDQPAPLLETLKLFNFRLSSTPTFSGVYPHLQRLMLLLVLNQCFGDEEIVPSTPRIRLPTLQVLYLTERETHTVFNVLKSLDIPQAAITVAWPGDFGREMTDANMETFWFEIDLFLRHLRIPLPIRHLDINRNHPHYSVDISSSPSHHRYSFQFLGQELDHRATFRWVNSVIPLDDIETLVINDLPDATLESISGLTNLKTITVSGIAAWTLIAVLADTFFPALKELTICDINLADEDMPALDDILILHEDAGFGLDKLVFVGCNNVDMEIFEDLANIVELVDELDI
ncbi:hypothetical protein BDN72DRAFT_836855 [Pluteus cervinus]|uniref:Uncharacterized protein n=1 Tax=Pluteus cervinus TaxID=181527 RepID=A0ACD3B1F1_9AGAR|nr:hypothetical protein BDN72DRAFT_836855 [Pluteus cervinus]